MVRGLAWGIVSGFTFALLVVMNRRWSGTRSATDIAFWQNGLAALALLPFALAGAGSPLRRSARATIMLLIVLGLACTALAHTLFIGGLAVVTAHTASVIAALEPVYGIVLALAFLGEVPGAAHDRRRRADRRGGRHRDPSFAPRRGWLAVADWVASRLCPSSAGCVR